jgi:hypothetical protein
MAFTVTRRPRSANVMHNIVRKEVRQALQELADKTKKELEDYVKDWEEKPKFTVKVGVSDEQWYIDVKVNRRNKIGRIFTWVDKGTGKRGGGKSYFIRPKKRNKSGWLRFTVPHSPKTLPFPTIAGFPANEPFRKVKTYLVIHPGIYPRNFTTRVHNKLAERNKPGSFKSVVDAAIKRAFRKISKGSQ